MRQIQVQLHRAKLGSTERALIGFGLGGVLVAAAAVGWPSAEHDARTPVVSAVVPPPAPADSTPLAPAEVTPPAMVVAASPMAIEASRPIVALAHEETDVDFEVRAKEQVEHGQLKEALDSLRKHLYRNAPTSPVLLEVARLASRSGEHALAEQALLDAGALDPTNAVIALERGRVLLETGELQEAREAARQAIRLDRDSAEAWNLAGRVAMAQSEWARAELALRQALQLDPIDPMLHNNLGLLYVMMRRGPDAVASMETALELYGDEAPAFVSNNLGLAQELNGELDRAREAFEAALKSQPDYARARVNLTRVLRVLADREDVQAMRSRTAEAPLEPAMTAAAGEEEPEMGEALWQEGEALAEDEEAREPTME